MPGPVWSTIHPPESILKRSRPTPRTSIASSLTQTIVVLRSQILPCILHFLASQRLPEHFHTSLFLTSHNIMAAAYTSHSEHSTNTYS